MSTTLKPSNTTAGFFRGFRMPILGKLVKRTAIIAALLLVLIALAACTDAEKPNGSYELRTETVSITYTFSGRNRITWEVATEIDGKQSYVSVSGTYKITEDTIEMKWTESSSKDWDFRTETRDFAKRGDSVFLNGIEFEKKPAYVE